MNRSIVSLFASVAVCAGFVLTGGVPAHASPAELTPNTGPTGGGTSVSIGPLEELADITFSSVEAGWNSTMATDTTGKTYTWGNNESGHLGTGTTTPTSVPVPLAQGAIPDGVTLVQLNLSPNYTVALGSDGKAYSWGTNSSTQLGIQALYSYEPAEVLQGVMPDGVRFTEVVSRGATSWGIGSDGLSYAWGFNNIGQIGDGTRGQNRPTPVRMVNGAIPADQRLISMGFGVGIASDSSTYSWGSNTYGQLGNGNYTNQLSPVRVLQGSVPDDVTFRTLDHGTETVLALGSDNKAYGWGSGPYGELGDGTNTPRTAPVPLVHGELPESELFTQLSVYRYHSLGLGSNNVLYSWGDNSNGQLGNDSAGTSPSPREVERGEMPEDVWFTQVSAGFRFSTGLGSDGHLYTWGDNEHGQLGDGSQTDRPAPVRVYMEQEVTGVTFDGVPASSFTQNSDGSVQAVTPPHEAATVDVEVAWELNGVTQPPISLPDAFTYEAPAPVFTSQPTDQTVDEGETATFRVTTAHADTVSWEVSADDGQSWQAVPSPQRAVPSEDGRSLSVVGNDSNSGDQFRAIATNPVASVASSPATLTVRADAPPEPGPPGVTPPGAGGSGPGDFGAGGPGAGGTLSGGSGAGQSHWAGGLAASGSPTNGLPALMSAALFLGAGALCIARAHIRRAPRSR